MPAKKSPKVQPRKAGKAKAKPSAKPASKPLAKARTVARVATPPRGNARTAPRPRPAHDLEPIARSAAAHHPLSAVRGAEPRAARGDGRGKYVYCIIQTKEPLRFGPIGIGAEPAEVHTVSYENIAAVVSDTPIEVHDPTRENVLAHERVNETVMRNHTVIPMSFGTVFKTREDIIELLRSAYDAFHDVLVKMQDKLEFGLKVLWDRDVIIREIEREDEDVRRLKTEIESQKGSTYFARMQYGRLIDAALQGRSERFVADIFEQLREVAVASRANKPIGDKMILNAAFLVARDSEAAFDARVKQIGAQYENLTFKYTGPWPPYNFVNIRLKLERAKEAK
jgi:hypothetical protein